MANLTVVIDEQLLQAARIKALQQGTSVNEICREAIARFALRAEAGAVRLEALRGLAEAMAQSRLPSPEDTDDQAVDGGAHRVWPGRAALYEGVLMERGLLGLGGKDLGDRATRAAGDAS